jgi:hypothetical protein
VEEAGTQSATALIGRPVVDAHGISLGLTADVLADRSLAHVLGFAVEAPRQRTFLPFAACSISGEEEITIASALSLLAAGELDYYEANGVSLVRLRARAQGADLLVDRRGRIAAVMLQPQQSTFVKVEVSNDLTSGRTDAQPNPVRRTMALPFNQP